MAKKRSRHEPRRPTIARRRTSGSKGREDAESQPLIQGLARTLYGDHPAAFLEAVSAIISATEPHRSPHGEDAVTTTLDDLVESFLGSDFTTTTAALHVIGALTPNELRAARLRSALGARTHALPAWVRGLGETRVAEVLEMRHVLRDGENYFLDVRLPDGFAMTVVVYLDNNLGQVVKDAFVLPTSVDEVLGRIRSDIDEDTGLESVDPAIARARIAQAVTTGRMMLPPLESDTWPMCRPLVEWLTRMLPAGGVVPQSPEWGPEELEGIAEEFLGSPYGSGLDDEDHRGLLQALLWIGSSYDLGDPLRWTPVNVELLLVDRAARKIIDDPAVLAKLPGLLGSFVRFAHAKQGFRAELTAQTLGSVDRWTPAYHQLIRDDDRPLGSMALARMLLADDRRPLEVVVGDAEQLAALTTAPLPDEAFDWTGIEEDIRGRVGEILTLCDANAEQLLDIEHRTANRRLLRAVVLADQQYFRGRAAANTSAAAISWMVAHANDSVGYGGDLTAGELLRPFGVRSASQRAKQFRDALGLGPHHPDDGPMALGSPDLLVGTRREELIEQRDLMRGPR